MTVGVSNLPVEPHQLTWLAGVSFGRTIRDSRLRVCVTRLGTNGPVRGCPESIELPVVALPGLRSGFVWKERVLTDELTGNCVRATLSNLHISADGTKFVRIFTEPCNDLTGKPLTSGFECVLKPGNHPLPPEAQGAWAVRLENVRFNNQSNAERVLVPCLELLRFYFCTSSYLTDQLVQFGLFDHTMLYSEARPETPTEPAYIRLVNRLASTDVPVIARIAFDPAAAREAKRVGASLRAGAESNPGAACCFPKMGFPFNGRAEISCVGRWVMTHEGYAFLVLSLLRCSARFPFQRLEFSGPGDSGPQSLDPSKALVVSRGAPDISAAGSAQQMHPLVDKQAVGLPETKSFAREEAGSRFEFPFAVQRIRLGTAGEGNSAATKSATSSNPASASVGAAGLVGDPLATHSHASLGIRHISRISSPSKLPGTFDPDRVMENFIHAIAALQSRALGWHPIETTHVSCGDMPNATFTEFSTSVVGPWASLGSESEDEPERAGKPRLAYVLAVECARCHSYFIEIDRLHHEAGMHTRVAYRRDGKKISDTTLTKLMQLLYEARGGDPEDWKKFKDQQGLETCNFEHTSYGVDKRMAAEQAAQPTACQQTQSGVSENEAARRTAEKMFKWLKATVQRSARHTGIDASDS